MSHALVARRDEDIIAQLGTNLPQSLLLISEQGLDSQRVTEFLANTEPSHVRVVIPEKDKRVIGVQQVRDVIASVRTYAQERRVIIFRPAAAMTEEAQNALLKALEEPSTGLHFVLEAESRTQVLPTILSRCHTIELHRTSSLQDNTLLKGSSLDEQTRQQIRFLAAGRPALIRRLVSEPTTLKSYQELAADAKRIMQEPPYKSLVVTQKYSSSREKSLALIDVLLTIVRFQMTSRGPDAKSDALIDRISITEQALRQNANVKLALLGLVV